MTRDEAQRPDTGADAKKPYVEPKLVEYGSISKLTQLGTGSFADALGAQMMMMPTI